jgi:hypothetical protein
MTDDIMKKLKEAYKEWWGEDHGYHSASTNRNPVQKEDKDVSVDEDEDKNDNEDEDKDDNEDEDEDENEYDNKDEDEDKDDKVDGDKSYLPP